MSLRRLTISRRLWRKLVLDLRRRGDNCRESGAFLLARVNSTKITTYVCYDDLDPNCLDDGIIVFRGGGYVILWERCLKTQLKVVADVHTHPGFWTNQSHADKTHPMVGLPGHLALIVPNFARGNSLSLRGVGTHRYLGNHEWKSFPYPRSQFALTFT